MSLTSVPQGFYAGNVLCSALEPFGPASDLLALDAGFATAPYLTANAALLHPILVPEPFNAVQAFVANGTTASGNFDIGLYTEAGARQWSIGSTAQSGTSTLQLVNMSDQVIPRGRWLLAIAMDNTTGTIIRANPGAQILRLAGCFQVATSFPLPSSLTLASPSDAYLPIYGVTSLAGGL